MSYNNILIVFGGMFFVFFGIYVLYKTFLPELMKYRISTIEVTCKCVDVKRVRQESNKITFVPVWEYQYGGETRKWSPDYNTNIAVPHIGQFSLIYLSMEDGRVLFINNSIGVRIKFSLFSMCFIGAGIMIMQNFVY